MKATAARMLTLTKDIIKEDIIQAIEEHDCLQHRTCTCGCPYLIVCEAMAMFDTERRKRDQR